MAENVRELKVSPVNSGLIESTAIQGAGDFLRTDDFYETVLAMASHDLRQPLQLIISAQELLARRLTTSPEREHLERSERASAQLAEQLDQLVDALHLHRSTGRIRLEPVPLQPILERLAQQLDGPARRKGVCLRLSSTPAVVMSHAALLDSVLRNLVRNALDYTLPGGRVLVCCRRHRTAFRIEVRDSGEGIPPDKLSTVFEPFSRLDAAHSDGLGLGLFIVQRAAECLGASDRGSFGAAPGLVFCRHSTSRPRPFDGNLSGEDQLWHRGNSTSLNGKPFATICQRPCPATTRGP
jgi:signal transduction histidine kinase